MILISFFFLLSKGLFQLVLPFFFRFYWPSCHFRVCQLFGFCGCIYTTPSICQCGMAQVRKSAIEHVLRINKTAPDSNQIYLGPKHLFGARTKRLERFVLHTCQRWSTGMYNLDHISYSSSDQSKILLAVATFIYLFKEVLPSCHWLNPRWVLSHIRSKPQPWRRGTIKCLTNVTHRISTWSSELANE